MIVKNVLYNKFNQKNSPRLCLGVFLYSPLIFRGDVSWMADRGGEIKKIRFFSIAENKVGEIPLGLPQG
jgi:hypothetical protein